MAAIAAFTVDNASPMATNWATSAAGGGLNGNGTTITPSSYAADVASSYNGTNAHSTADHRLKVTVNFTTLGPFALYARLTTEGDLTTDHIRVKFTPGTSVAPAWDDPDTFQIIERVSGVETPITPSNTSSGVHTIYPAWDATAKTFSLRDKRFATGDTVTLWVVNDQVMVFVNDILYAHETCTVDQTGSAGIINYSDGSADNTYAAPRGGDLIGRYIDTATGDDTGTGLVGDPWKTIDKLLADQAVGEVGLVQDGTYPETQFEDTLVNGVVRTATHFEDPVSLMAVAGATVGTRMIWLNGTGQRFYLMVNIDRINPVPTSTTNIMKLREGSQPHQVVGGSIKGGHSSGLLITPDADAGPDYTGGHLIKDMLFHGNGQDTGPPAGNSHNIYCSVDTTTFEYCTLDGSDAGNGVTDGEGLQIYDSAGDTNSCNNSVMKYCVVKNHAADTPGGKGIILGRGTAEQAIGNKVYANRIGIEVGFQTTDCEVLHNDVYENVAAGISIGPFTATDTLVYNNTCARNATGIDVTSGSTGAKLTNNITESNTTSDLADNGVSTTALTNFDPATDPLFVDPANDDQELQETSTAKTGATAIGAIAAIDKNGFARPQGASWAHGAFEFPDPETLTNVLPATFAITQSTPTVLSGISVMVPADGPCTVLLTTDKLTTLTATAGTSTVEVDNS